MITGRVPIRGFEFTLPPRPPPPLRVSDLLHFQIHEERMRILLHFLLFITVLLLQAHSAPLNILPSLPKSRKEWADLVLVHGAGIALGYFAAKPFREPVQRAVVQYSNGKLLKDVAPGSVVINMKGGKAVAGVDAETNLHTTFTLDEIGTKDGRKNSVIRGFMDDLARLVRKDESAAMEEIRKATTSDGDAAELLEIGERPFI